MKDGLHINSNGTKYWYLEGKYHRVDGPAIECPDGTKYWYLEGKCHRVDGPAVEFPDGTKEWWYKNIRIGCDSQKEFESILKLKAFW